MNDPLKDRGEELRREAERIAVEYDRAGLSHAATLLRRLADNHDHDAETAERLTTLLDRIKHRAEVAAVDLDGPTE